MYPPQPAYRAFINMQSFLFVIICENLFFYQNLFKSFLLVRFSSLCENFFESFFMGIFFESLVSENLFDYLFIYDHPCESIFLSLYENKQAYEFHLKQISCHQNMIMIFCLFRMFLFYAFCFEFFSFYA